MLKSFLGNLLIAVIFGTILGSCNVGNKDSYGCKFMKDKNSISIHEQTDCDVRSSIILQNNQFTGRLESKINLCFYNYGKDIIINPRYQEDNFLPFMSQCCQYYIVSSENIMMKNVTNDEIYGEWGIANVDVPNYNRYFTDVFISPLAFNKINNHDDDNYLILAKFMSIDTNSCFIGVFLCDNTIAYVVSNEYDNIVINSPMSLETDFNLNLRKELMPKDIHNKYLETEKYVYMGIVDKSSLKFADKYILR